MKIMIKKILSAFAIALFATMPVSAQNNPRGNFNPEKMVERMAENLAKSMDLKDDAETKFIELYKNYQTEKMNITRDLNGDKKVDDSDKAPNFKKLSDEEAQKYIDAYFANEQAQLELDKTYYAKFKEILTPSQCARVFVSKRGMPNNRTNMNRNRPNRNSGFGGPMGGFGGSEDF